VTWELIREIEERPDGRTVAEVVCAIKDAIASGWQERAENSSKRTKLKLQNHATTLRRTAMEILLRVAFGLPRGRVGNSATSAAGPTG
jgi:hypothetical protein